MVTQSLATQRPEIPALTSLRFFAAFWVVLFHIREFGLWRGGTAPYLAVIQLGYLGVSFFFVLSGFILVYVYAGRAVSKRRFWQARFARAYPVYLFSLLVTAPGIPALLPYLRLTHGSPAVAVPAFLLLLEAWLPRDLLFWNAVAWSLSVEAFFYFVFPYAMRLLERASMRALLAFLGCSWMLSLVITFGYFLARPDGVAWPTSQDNLLYWLAVVKFHPLVRLPEFFLGMGTGVAFLRARPQAKNWAILLGLGLMAFGAVFQGRIPYPVMHSGLLAPAFALVIYGFASQPQWSRVLAVRPLLLLGEASYSLYLLHAFVLGVMIIVLHLDRSPHLAVVVVTYIASMLLLAIGVYAGIENPLRKWLRPRRLPQRVPAVA